MASISAIESMDQRDATKLRKAGVRTTDALLKTAAKRTGRRRLAKQADLSESDILSWVNRADLMRFKGVGSEYADLLEAAGIVPVKGLILGSMSANLIPLAKKMDYPIMIVDGFRETPMNKAAEKILIENKDKNIALNAQELDTFQGKFPEGIISQSSTTEPELPSEDETLKAGKKVIIINGPQAPQIGEIEKIISGKQVLSSGVETQLAEVTLANDKSTIIPLTNLEIIND